MELSAREIAQAVNGALYGGGTAASVSTDSRTLEPGSLFVPLVGERFDGHAYLDASSSRYPSRRPTAGGSSPGRR